MAINSRYKLKTGEEVAYFPPIQNTANPYLTEAAMHADQANQLEGYGYLVTGVGAFTYLGTVAGSSADYEAFGYDPDAALTNVANVFTESQQINGQLLLNGGNDTIARSLSIIKDANSNPQFYDFKVIAGLTTAGWRSGIRFLVKEYNLNAYTPAFIVESDAENKYIAKAMGNFSVVGNSTLTGDLTVNGVHSLKSINLVPNSLSIIDRSSYDGGAFVIRQTDSLSPYRIFDLVVSSTQEFGWRAKYRIIVKDTDTAELEAIVIVTDGTAKPITEIKGRLKTPSDFNLSNLGSYADDAAANTGGVAIGYAYINSSTGAMHRRLT